MDETCIEVKGRWAYLYRAVDKYGKTIDFLLTDKRDEPAAKKFLIKAIRRHGGVPEKITIDGSSANEAAIKSYNEDHGTSIEIRQIKYLNNIVEQDHRGVKRITKPMMGFPAFESAQSTLIGIELIHMLRKNQLEDGVERGLSVADQFYSLVSWSPRQAGFTYPQIVDTPIFATEPVYGAAGIGRSGHENDEVMSTRHPVRADFKAPSITSST